MVGDGTVLQHTPEEVIMVPPLLVISPPEETMKVPAFCNSMVVTAGNPGVVNDTLLP